MLTAINQGTWTLTGGGRQRQQFGFYWDETTRLVGPALPFPPWLGNLCRLLPISWVPTQCIINKYAPNTGINYHIDDRVFGPVVLTVSLGATATMWFRKPGCAPHQVRMEPGMITQIRGPARWEWQHGIPTTTTNDGDQSVRVSITLRTVTTTAGRGW